MNILNVMERRRLNKSEQFKYLYREINKEIKRAKGEWLREKYETIEHQGKLYDARNLQKKYEN